MAAQRQRQRQAAEALSPTEREVTLGRLQGEMYLCANGVVQQAGRLAEGNQPAAEFMADGRALTYFLRDVMRIAETCMLLVEDERRDSIASALRRVERALPDTVDARNALEHCDDYVLGIGRRQRTTPGDYAQRYSRGSGALVVRVGDLVIDIKLAARAAQHLAAVVVTGTDHLALLSTS